MPGWMGRGVVMPLSPFVDWMAVALETVGLGAAAERPALARKRDVIVENLIVMIGVESIGL
jgi:hypothetical protein